MRTHVLSALIVVAAAGYGCFAPQDRSNDDSADSVEAKVSSTDQSASRGTHDFHDGTLFKGNGRSCADCHVDKDGFQLTPARAMARYQALLQARQTNPSADDPLFRPIDADDFRTNGDFATDYSELTQNGLVRISFPLPANVKMVDDATGQVTADTFVDVWRSVPSVYNVKITGPDGSQPTWPRGPNQNGGYQLDARVDTLQNQANGAFFGHIQVKTAPSSTVLDDISHYEQTLFSSDDVKTISKAIDNGLTPPDLPTNLTDDEQKGKALFDRSCRVCHGGPGFSTPEGPPLIRYHFIFSGCARPVDSQSPPRWKFDQCPTRLKRNIRTYQVTLADGTVIRKKSSDPGRFLLTGVTQLPGAPPPSDDWERFDIAPLRGISETAPYFHNNSADTLADVVNHYQQFYLFIQANNPTAPLLFTATGESRLIADADKPYIIAYLNRL